MNTLVLTSAENFVWQSMQEIIPSLERTWLKSGRKNGHFVERVNVDESPLSSYMAKALAAENIVLTCFNHKLARTAVHLRKTLSVEARFFIYLHNQATIGCWPFHHWGLGEVLREDDVFISSCTRDQEAFSLCFKNASSRLLPFTLETPPKFLGDVTAVRVPPFVYVGRLSDQKNLSCLLEAFQPLARENKDASLILYGGEDGLGSPNMGLASTSVLKDLKDQCSRLEIGERVHFMGFTAREKLWEDLCSKPHVFVSPSLHSDENFGMAAFFSLALGMPAVLTAWGGHQDFPAHFPGQVHLVSVREKESRPWVDPKEFGAALNNSRRSFEKPHEKSLPEVYSEERVSRTLYEWAKEKSSPGRPLEKTELAEKILRQKKQWEKENPCRIFTSYQDPLTAPFFRAYGMKLP